MARFYTYKTINAEAVVLNNCLINQVSEGFKVDLGDVDIIEKIARTHFQDRPWVYVSNRFFSYSLDPFVYERASELKNLAGFAITVCGDEARKSAEFEQHFTQKPFKIFENITQALIWAHKLCPSTI